MGDARSDNAEKMIALLERIAKAVEARPVAAAPRASAGGLVFPPYGRSKGTPVAGASKQDLDFYRAGCERTLADPEKARFHERERVLLAAILKELGEAPPADDGPPPADDVAF